MTRPLKKDLDKLDLESQVQKTTNILISQKINSSAIGFLRPQDQDFETVAHSLKTSSPNALILLHYLIQIRGELAQDLLRIFAPDPRSGGFIADLPAYLDELFQLHRAEQLRAIAA